MLFRLRDRLGDRPLPIPQDLDADAFIPITDATRLLDALRASPLVAPQTVSATAGRWRWNTPDGGQLEIGGAAPVISINCHAHWDHVAQLFDMALAIWPDIVLFDLQSAHLHDPASLREFSAQTDAARAARDAGA